MITSVQERGLYTDTLERTRTRGLNQGTERLRAYLGLALAVAMMVLAIWTYSG